MSFMLKKKKYKFKVNLILQELSDVTLVNEIIFAKIRLIHGGTFTEFTEKQEIKNNCVKWDTKFQFNCKMTANATTGVLEPCICKISVRKEARGGRSFKKFGFANLNLAEFAGAGLEHRKYLLDGYDSKNRQDNSRLHVTIEMFLLVGDPCFKKPQVQTPIPLGDNPRIQLPADRKGDDYNGDGLGSRNSGFGSLTRLNLFPDSPTVVGAGDDKSKDTESLSEFERGHSQNSSYRSQHSTASGYSILAHSRQNCAGFRHQENSGSSSNFDVGSPIVHKTPDRNRPSKKQTVGENGMDSTRVNAKEVINEVVEATNLELDDSAESSGLRLIVKDDGTLVLSTTHELPECSGHFGRVIVSPR